jgi:hypothetical protein
MTEENKDTAGQTQPQTREDKPKETPAQEWGERQATGKTIDRGGKTGGHVRGASEQQP